MWKIIVHLSIYVILSSGSQLTRILKDVDRFPPNIEKVDDFLAGYTENNSSISLRFKRNIGLVIEKLKGTQIQIELVPDGAIPIANAIDYHFVTIDGQLHVLLLEANADLQNETLLSLYNFQELKRNGPAKTFTVFPGAYLLEVFKISDSTLLIVSATRSVNGGGTSILKFENNVITTVLVLGNQPPNSIKLVKYLDVIYLAIATQGNLEIYEWKERYFDLKQVLPTKGYSSLTLFTLNSFLFLAAVRGSSINENEKPCGLWQLNLETNRFECRQILFGDSAVSITYFKFISNNKGRSQHFLSVAFENNPLVIYKYDEVQFLPFQELTEMNVSSVYPIEGGNGECTLFISKENNISALYYDGFKFRALELNLNNISHNISSLRSFSLQNRIWLVAGTFSNPNIFKLNIMKNTGLSKSLSDLDSWCEHRLKSTSDILQQQEFHIKNINDTKQYIVYGDINLSNANITMLNTKVFGNLNEKLVNEVNDVNGKIEEVENMLVDVGSFYETVPAPCTLIIGPIKLHSLELKCSEEKPCILPQVSTDVLNKVNFPEFLNQTIHVKDGLNFPGTLDMQQINAGNIVPTFINTHPAESLLSRDADLDIGGSLHLNGTALFHGPVFLKGEIGGVFLDREHALLKTGNQTLAGTFHLYNGTIDDLNITDFLNGVKLSSLGKFDSSQVLKNPEAYLNVNNIQLHGYLAGHNVTSILDLALNNGTNALNEFSFGDVNIEDGNLLGIPVSDIVRIDEGDFNLPGSVVFSAPATIHNLTVTTTLNQIPLSTLSTFSGTKSITHRDVSGDKIIVKGSANVPDIIDSDGNSLVSILRQALPLSETNISTKLVFNNVSVEELPHFDLLNDQPFGDRDGPPNLDCGEEKSAKLLYREDENGLGILEVYGPVSIDRLSVNSLKTSGAIAGVDWDSLVEDAVVRNSSYIVNGEKTIDELMTVEELEIDGSINQKSIDDFVSLFENPIVIADDIELDHGIFVEKLDLKGSAKHDTEPDWIHNDTISLPIAIKSAVFEGGLKVSTINNVNISNLIQNSIRIDTPSTVSNITFVDNVTFDGVFTSKTFNGAEFNDSILRKTSKKPQILNNNILIDGNVKVDGTLEIDGNLNGFNFSKICLMSRSPPNVIVKGRVIASTEPKIAQSVNKINLDELKSKLWFSHIATSLKRSAKLPHCNFINELNITGLVNGIKLQELPNNYLSKTIPRKMLVPLYVKNLTLLGETLVDNLKAKVNGLNITEFASNVLIQGANQTFSGRPRFNLLHSQNLTGNFTVNNVNLAHDVLRYDLNDAVITGTKQVHHLDCDTLNTPPGVQVQEVDVPKWGTEAVLHGEDTHINGSLTFSSLKVDGILGLVGRVGNTSIDSDHLFTTDGRKEITGRKTFISSLAASSLVVGGLFHHIDFDNVIRNAGYKNKNLLISEDIELQELSAENMVLNGEFTGVEIGNICNLTQNPSLLPHLNDDYHTLLNVSHRIRHHVANGAYYLDHYRLIQKLRNVTDVAYIPGTFEPAVVNIQSYLENRSMSLYWDTLNSVFKKKDYHLMQGNVTAMKSGNSSGMPYLLVEKFGEKSSLITEKSTYSIDVNNTSCFTTVILQNGTLCVFIGMKYYSSSIRCPNDDTNAMEFIKFFDSSTCVQAVSVTSGNLTWIALMESNDHSVSFGVNLIMYSLTESWELQPRHVMAVLNPVSMSLISHDRKQFLAVASKHQPESVRSSVIAIFRCVDSNTKWTRYQDLPIDAPITVEFAELPNGQLVLYALTANPTRPFVVYLYRGAEGFVFETAGYILYPGSKISAFSVNGQHFVSIVGSHLGQILMAEMRGTSYG